MLLLVTGALLVASCAAPSPPPQEVGYRSGNPDFDRMIRLALAMAEELLRYDDSFVPFAAAVKTTGELTGVLAIEPQLSTSAAVNRTVGELVRGARTGMYRSTGVCTDVIAPLMDNASVSDAISIILEDEDESRGFILPYERSEAGVLTFGTPYFREEQSLVFQRAVAI